MQKKMSGEKSKQLSNLYDETINNRKRRKSISMDIENANKLRLTFILNPKTKISKKDLVAKYTIKPDSSFY